jgi:glycosyltransferase involved in cell wall biosynthesis
MNMRQTGAGAGADTVIGVVIRTLNESELIGRCLETLRRQQGRLDLDIVVVDSGSTDTTIEIARSYDARIVNLSPGDFDYSKALNVGIDEVRGDLVISISAHAIPVDNEWLRRMTAPFDDPRVAGVSSRQVPWPDAPWQEANRLQRQFGELGHVYAQENGGEIVFSNAASAIRRSAWHDHRFTLPAAEDLDWAHRVIAAGWAIVYEPEAVVYHSHYENPREQALRMIDINRVVDPEGGRHRWWRTVREAVGLLLRDSRTILKLDEPRRRKVRYLADLLRMVFYYVVDFSRSGTTAERRREDSGGPSHGDSDGLASKSETQPPA